MEQSYSTSKVTVEYFDPHDVFKLLAPGLVPRLPLRNLHWQSHAGPLRSIDTLHIELLSAGDKTSVTSPVASPHASGHHLDTVISREDGFQTQIGAKLSSEGLDPNVNRNSTPARRHQIPGLRRTPYLKVLLVRCDDNDSYKGHVRQDIRDWIKTHTPPSGSKRNTAENHDAFEWLIIHVVIPNTVAATQPRDSGSAPEKTSAVSKWRPGSSTLFEKLRSDFNTSSKGGVDRIAQIRIGVNDVPYDILPRVVPAVPSGYSETEQETENSWTDLVSKFRSLILSSFDLRVSQYEEDIREKDSQRTLPGWNFCTFFILKEGLARGFESVGLVEDALVGYDELSVGLDMIVQDQASTGSRSATNALLSYTEELKEIALKAKAAITGSEYEDDEETVDLQSQTDDAQSKDIYDDIPISSTKKSYRDLIVANNVSVFDFRCYIFARQISLLLRLGNAWSTREELLAKLKEQQESVLHGVAPRAPPPKQKENEHEDLTMLAEICRRTLEFIPTVSQVMRNDVFAALSDMAKADGDDALKASQADPMIEEVVENLVASFAFSIAQQILAQTSTKALPIPPSTLTPQDAQEPKAAIPEPKTMMHPARSSSLIIQTGRGANVGRPLPSPNVFPGRQPSASDDQAQSSFLKAGLEELAAKRAELYMLSRNILAECGKKRGWADGWATVPVIGESTMVEMVDIDLDGDDDDDEKSETEVQETPATREAVSISGVDSKLLKTALDNREDFYRLYETLTDKALRHYTVADHTHSVKTSMADIAVLKYHLGDYAAASSYFWETIPFFGESGWSLLELSMLVMCSRCLKQLQRKDEYVKVVLKLLTKAAAAERDRQQQKSAFRLGKQEDVDYPDSEAIKGFLDDLLAATKTLPNELRIPLSSFISIVEVDGPPEYHQGRDGISLNLKVNSLLVDNLRIDNVKVRVVGIVNKSSKDIWFELTEPTTIKPGKNKLKLNSNSAIPGSYEIDKVDFKASNLHLHHEREAGQPVDKASDTLQSPYLAIYHRSETLDVKLRASKHIQLDRNNTVDVDLDPGWNNMLNAEIRVKAATGGLRLLTSEAKCISSSINFSKKPEGGLFCFGAIPQNSTVRIRFPYTVEQETFSISIRIEVSYTTEDGSFFFSKTPVVETALALGVNVQDVFKHKALFSRFTVSTASQSPLRLFKSELVSSEVFDSEFGAPPSAPVVIFPKQPASLLYKIMRKMGVKIGPKTKKTMYLRLHYSVLQDEIESLVEDSLTESLEDKPLRPFSRLICSIVIPHVRHGLTGQDLERAVLLGSVPTAFLSSINWAKYFVGLGKAPDGTDYSKALVSFLRTWQAEHPKLALEIYSVPAEPRSILIPVDIPSLTIVHTADVRLQPPPQQTPSALSSLPDSPTPTVCTNQLLPAILHLKWTRMWDTTTPPAEQTDLEFSYELAAPQDTWLLGGRRKGHFVIPAPSSPSLSGAVTGAGGANVKVDYESTPDTEAEIPILLVPLREGWLPYPTVEIREVRPYEDAVGSPVGGGAGAGTGPGVHFETDVRNLGETVRVIADRARVTLSLDASGPGGGPLVLDVERLGGGAGRGRVVA
ncbi:trafficking protein particle complex subunit 10 [Annulohypoxylon truncatum]|uniref:trafficking protein particle complex subunit 10 n=1 Tax=Annulohypoxylon truncatum TaxID=327061 RepID=UPI0020073104|nr:trafficking protein particle complex subunit 10 [Annulohypoxylon truncatum]KAI1205291.1 trafficking protein particle complex subunit 10 [Annulohypoxylon truncatum]